MTVPRKTSPKSGFANIAAPTYASSTSASHRNTFRIKMYEPKI
jgi:hypothetical protein